MVQCDPRGVDVLLAILQVRDLYQQADTGNQKEEKKTSTDRCISALQMVQCDHRGVDVLLAILQVRS